jgi:hypothetical protein
MSNGVGIFIMSVCTEGPAAPEAPASSGSTETTVTWQYSLPSGNGLPIARVLLQVSNASSSFSSWMQIQILNITAREYTITGLVASNEYRARIAACTSSKCSNFSATSAPAITPAPSSAAKLASLSAVLSDQKTLDSLSKAANVTVLTLEAVAPPLQPAEQVFNWSSYTPVVEGIYHHYMPAHDIYSNGIRPPTKSRCLYLLNLFLHFLQRHVATARGRAKRHVTTTTLCLMVSVHVCWNCY